MVGTAGPDFGSRCDLCFHGERDTDDPRCADCQRRFGSGKRDSPWYRQLYAVGEGIVLLDWGVYTAAAYARAMATARGASENVIHAFELKTIEEFKKVRAAGLEAAATAVLADLAPSQSPVTVAPPRRPTRAEGHHAARTSLADLRDDPNIKSLARSILGQKRGEATRAEATKELGVNEMMVYRWLKEIGWKWTAFRDAVEAEPELWLS